MAVPGQENLIPMSERSKEEVRAIARKGGINSGETRRKKKTMRETLEMMLEEVADIEGNKNKLTYRELATLGLLKGAVVGNNANYKTILETIGELQEGQTTTTPTIKIEINDNSKLEGVMYEENRHNENDK